MIEKFTAIIPARGGSKGVPGKNIKTLSGYPMIAFSIIAAKLSKKIDQVIVSTDSKNIAKVAKKFGAEIPFYRPKTISKDSSTDIQFIKHAINWYDKHENYIPSHWVILRPTTPLRNVKILDNSINKIKKHKDSTSLVSVHEISETPAKMFGKNGNYLHGLSPFDPRKEYYTLPRQEFPPAFSGNGYVDIIKTSTIMNDDLFYGNKILAYDTGFVNEVDTVDDFKTLEKSLEIKNNQIFKNLQKNF